MDLGKLAQKARTNPSAAKAFLRKKTDVIQSQTVKKSDRVFTDQQLSLIVRGMIEAEVAKIPKPQDGKAITKAELHRILEDMLPTIKEAKTGVVERHVDAITNRVMREIKGDIENLPQVIEKLLKENKIKLDDIPRFRELENRVKRLAENQKWIKNPSTGGYTDSDVIRVVNGLGLVATSLDGLSDVEITTPSNGQVLKYDGTKWVNGTDGGSTVDVVSNVAENTILGRVSAGSGNSEELTATQVRTLINVENGATADQTGAEIKALYEAEADTNAYTDAEKTKVGHISVTQAVDLDAIETRVNELDASVVLMGTWDASAGTFPGSGTAQAGQSWIVSVGGTVDSQVFVANDRIVAITDNASTTTYASNWHKLDYTDAVLSVNGQTGAIDLSSVYEPLQAVVSGSLTAVLNTYYVNVASATYTDPTPTEGRGFIVFVRNGTATVGGTGYSTAGTIVHRIYHSGAWANYVYQVSSTFVEQNSSPTLADLQITGHTYADGEVDNGNSGTADTVDWGVGNFQKSTLTGNCTFTFTAPDGPGRFQLKLIQDGTGSRTATWPASVKWPSGTAPTLSTAAASIDIITFYFDGSSYYGVGSLNFS